MNKYSSYKIVNFPEKLKSFRDGKITAPLYVRIKPTNKCVHQCAACLPAGTKILSEGALKEITTFVVGDIVDAPNGLQTKVTQIHEREVEQIIIIKAGSRKIRITSEHEVLLSSGFKKAGEIKIGDEAIVRMRMWKIYWSRQKRILELFSYFFKKQTKSNTQIKKSVEELYIQGIKLERGLELQRINSIQKINKKIKVYNITCSPYEFYEANGVVVHNCIYEPSYKDMHLTMSRKDELPLWILSNVIRDLSEMEVKAITWSGGGEPLLYPFIEDIFTLASKYQISQSIITNGQLLEGDKIEVMKDFKWVRVSMEYFDDQSFEKYRGIPGRFRVKIFDNIKKFNEIKNPECDLQINYIINRENYIYIYDMCKLFKDMGLANVRFAPLWIPNFSNYHKEIEEDVKFSIASCRNLFQDENFKVYDSYDIKFQALTCQCKKCYIAQTVPVIAADGGVYTCHNKAYDPLGLIGNINDKSFKELWFSEETRKFFSEFSPLKSCKTHQCSANKRNMIIAEILDASNDSFI